MRLVVLLAASLILILAPGGAALAQGTPVAETPPESCLTMQTFSVPAGSHPHDVAPAADGQHVWYTAQRAGASAGSIRPRARSRPSRSATAPRRTASSSGPTARPGSPTAD